MIFEDIWGYSNSTVERADKHTVSLLLPNTVERRTDWGNSLSSLSPSPSLSLSECILTALISSLVFDQWLKPPLVSLKWHFELVMMEDWNEIEKTLVPHESFKDNTWQTSWNTSSDSALKCDKCSISRVIDWIIENECHTLGVTVPLRVCIIFLIIPYN